MRLIDADKLIMHLTDYQYSIPYGYDDDPEDIGAYYAVGECIKAIAEAPTIGTKQVKYFDDDKVWKIGEVIVAEQTEPYEYEIKALHKEWVEPKAVIEPKGN